MHRSGTSALAGVLNILGVKMGSNFMVPAPWNPKGNFELLDAYNLNEKILGRLNSSWDNPYVMPDNWWADGFNEHEKEIAGLIKSNFDAEMSGIKDPRLCRLLPLWIKVFKELGIEIYFVIPLRSPLETANSLKRRNGFPVEKSLLLWMIYMLEAEFYSREYPRVFITYDNLLKNTSNVINRICTKLNIEFPKDYQNVEEDIARFLDHSLKHHTQEPDSMQMISEEIFNYYQMLSLLADERAGKNCLLDIDKIRNRHYSLNKLFLAEKELALAEKQLVMESYKSKYESKLIYIPWLKKVERNLKKSFRLQRTNEK